MKRKNKIRPVPSIDSLPIDKKKVEYSIKHFESVLHLLGHDTQREGLKETPKRYIKFLNEFCTPPDFEFTTFEKENYDQMIIVKEIPFYSLCEHHLAPFFGTAHIAYIPNKRIVGLSKIPRTLEKFSRRPQNQERITNQVAEYLMENLKAKGVGVILEARHMCVEMRGVEKPGCVTITSALLGNFKDHNVKSEFISLTKK